ncbi:MAG: phosphotransferase [Parvibaculum sp.]|nr:phosphotransferase [Parvibaculum sp.]
MLLTLQGEDLSEFSACPCREGGNNLVYEIHLRNKRVLAKKYYRSGQDPRDRLGAEWSLIVYAIGQGISNVPKPIAKDEENGIGLYEFIEGRKLSTQELNARHVDMAADFFVALNGADRAEYAKEMPVASEACFSIADHCSLIDRRVARLAAIEIDDEAGKEARSYVAEIEKVWTSTKRVIKAELAICQLEPDQVLPSVQRCVSPSDFGFHNALLRPDGGVTFIDFEYAGLDDPAKMAADFFCQPQVPVSADHFERFLERTMFFCDDAEGLKRRARILLPAQKLKWACIMLNDFLPDDAKRRRFANPEAEKSLRKRMQLDKVRVALTALKH